MTDASAAVVQKLKEAGLEIIVQDPIKKMVVERAEVRKLDELAKFDFVRLIEPGKMRLPA